MSELPSELQPGQHISGVSGGAKHFSCKVINSETWRTCCQKVQGLGISKWSAKKVVNHDVMVDLVLSKEELHVNGLCGMKIEVPFFYIARDDEFNLCSHVVKKNYSLVFDKCVLEVNKGYKTFPYGYKKPV